MKLYIEILLFLYLYSKNIECYAFNEKEIRKNDYWDKNFDEDTNCAKENEMNETSKRKRYLSDVSLLNQRVCNI